MRTNREYTICKAIAIYMRLKYPNVLYRFDMAGLNLSITQAGMNKAIQYGKGWPDLFIAEPKEVTEEIGESTIVTYYNGLFIEVKKEGTNLWKAKGGPASDHIKEQIDCLNELEAMGYKADFGIGLDDCIQMIDKYLTAVKKLKKCL